MRLNFTQVKELAIEAGKEWVEDKGSRLGAAVAYYTVFSIAPLLLIAIAIAGFVFGEEAAQGTIASQIDQWVGKEGGEAIQSMLKGAEEKKGQGIFATVISTVLLLVGASGVFVQLKDALNTVWDVPEKEQEGGIWGFIKSRFLSFGFVLGVGFLLLASLLLSTILSAFGKYLGGYVTIMPLLHILNFVISFAVITGLFALIFKYLPDITLPWRDVLLGAVMTSLLFTVGKVLLGLYLGKSSMSSAYGAAGSFVVLLVWIYYSAQIVFYGAELTQVYSRKYGAWQGREKLTQRQKEAGVQRKPVQTEEERVAAIPDPEPGKLGKAVGKAVGAVVTGVTAVDQLRKKVENGVADGVG